MGNADWNPAQTRVFDVYMAGGGDRGGGQGLMDIFSCNGGNNVNGEGDDNNESSNSSSSSSTSTNNEDTHSNTRADTTDVTNNNCAIGVNLAENCITSGSGINAAGPASTADSSGHNFNSESSPSLISGTTELCNTGTGRTAPSLTPEFFERLKRRKVESQPPRVTPALNLQTSYVSSSTNMEIGRAHV